MLARIALGLMRLLAPLPLALLAPLGVCFGMLLYALARERRRVALVNLARCFPQMTPGERCALARAHFRAFGRSVLERSLLWWAPRERIVEIVRLRDREALEAAIGSPVILLAPHFVGLDAGWTRLSCELDMASMYSRQKNRAVDAALLRGRTRFGRQRLYSRQEGIRPLLAALKEGVPLYYLPDLDYGARDAVFVSFFGVPAATVTALARLARIAGARVVPCVTRMLAGGAGYELRFYPAWKDFPSGDDIADARRMNAFIEERVREMPEQYFWTHKRFKTHPPGAPRRYD